MDQQIKFLVIANIIALAAFVLKELLSYFKDSTRENTKAIKELTETCGALAKDIGKLQTQMEYVHKDLTMIPEMKRDLDAAHEAIRELQVRCEMRHSKGSSHHESG